MRVFVTGIGIISAIGQNIAENLHNLTTKTSGIKFDPEFNELTGKVLLSNEELASSFQLNPALYSRSTLLALTAAKEALQGFPEEQLEDLGLISGTTVGGMDRAEQAYFNKLDNLPPNNLLDLRHENGNATEDLAELLGIRGYVNTISTACSSGANGILLGSRLVKSGRLKSVLVGCSDPIAHLNASGFRSLGVYSDKICKPFDSDRDGLNLGEGAAFLILEGEESVKQYRSTVLCEVTGYCNTSDAFHQTSSSPDGSGATRSMIGALEMAKLNPNEISYINAHGTATPNNDLSESIAIKNVFKKHVPPFSSTKCYTGHTLAAAGALEAVFSVLGIQNQHIYPTFNYESPIKETMMIPETDLIQDKEINHVLSNSFGFGGNCTSIILSKFK